MDTLNYIRFPGNTSAKYDMSVTGQSGCKASEDGDILSAPRIYELLETRTFGRHIRYKFTTASTNDDAKLLAGTCPEGTLVICETQTKGKGRLGRQWESPRGGIFMSLILKPDIDPVKLPPLSLVAGYATAKALARIGLSAKVKWPNDVLVHGRKLSGILCEVSARQDKVEYVIVGIGINAKLSTGQMPPQVRERSTSVLEQIGKAVDRSFLIAAVLNEFEPCYLKFLESGIESLIPEFQASMAYVGDPVMIQNTSLGSDAVHHGILQGLDSHGKLLIRTSTGEVKAFAAGDLSLRPQ
jgi:BirA family biotin operon repressor/biotin-[acetyl-CoA-carboxylase] ligase